MDQEEIIRLLVDVEQRFPVETWRVEGVPIWPLVRCAVYNNFHMFERVRAPLGLHRLGAALDIIKGPIRKFRANRRDHQTDRWRQVDALLLSDGVSTALVDEKYYDRFCDPLKFELDRRNYESLIVTTGSRHQTPRYSRGISIQPTVDLLRAGARFDSVRRPRQRELDGFDEATRWMQDQHPKAHFRNARSFERSAIYLRHLEGYFDRILRRTDPKVVFTVCYYGYPSMAALLACHRRGIPTVDIQHGCINEFHHAYGQWTKLPPGGYQTLPRFFWCWNESAVRTIEHWSRNSNGAHTPLQGGNLFREMWRDDSNPLVMKAAADVNASVRPANGRTRVLYTCNAFESNAELRLLANCIRETEANTFWFVRLHPSSRETATSRREALTGFGATTFDVHEAPTLPLYAMLRAVDIHVTEGSSSTEEAAEFDVPTLLLSDREAPLFQDLLTEGWAELLRDGEQLSRTIEALVERGHRLRAAKREQGVKLDARTRLDRIFQTLMGNG